MSENNGPAEALVTLSHGSRHPAAEAGIAELTRAAGRHAAMPAFMAHIEFTAPSLPELACLLARAGVRRLRVVPLLFSLGYHARHDVPRVVRAAEEASGMRVEACGHLGLGEDVADLLARVVEEDAPPRSDLLLYSVGSSVPGANEAVRGLAADVGRLLGRPMRFLPATGRGGGSAAVAEAAAGRNRMHIVPLFVTEGRILDALRHDLPAIRKAASCAVTCSGPLSTRLAGIVARRAQPIPVASPR